VLRVPDHSRLVVSPQIAPGTVEQYRRLAAVLHEFQASQGLKTLMVSSAVPREGKTLTAVNLAMTLSESYRRRVLLIDADLRRPSVHQVLGISNMTGLGEVLRGPDDRALPVIEISKNLSVLTAGRPDASPTAQLTSARLQALVKDVARRFDWVLLDTPPVGLLTDAQLVARLCDGVLFVIGAGTTPYHLVQRSIAELGAERIVGTVLNRVQEQALAGQYYGHDDSPSAAHPAE
jgi:capsular exopolysaccharide synthesis family protein